MYIGYWSFSDGLSLSTIRPHLIELSNFDEVKSITYISIERASECKIFDWDIPKVKHRPFLSKPRLFFLDKIYELFNFPRKATEICKKDNIDFVLCRSSMAGIYGYQIWKELKIPYAVESFEPHADYMRVSGVWNKSGLRYRIQKYFEKKQKETAKVLLPLTNAYKNALIKEGIGEDKLIVFPCTVDVDKYRFNVASREEIRNELGISQDRPVGIYVGKKGGMYYDSEIFRFFRYLYKELPSIVFLIITTQEKIDWKEGFKQVSVPESNFIIFQSSFDEVPNYLSAADFAFNFHRSSEVSQAFSPIKNREYWANGLPIIMGEYIGDDSDFISANYCGITTSIESPDFDNKDLLELLNGSHRNQNVLLLASKVPNESIIRDIYLKVFAIINNIEV
ncbi:MAG: glycosyltransferase [Cyclobacteriaceae bacterium]|nr:glycosyltransferase [Cyclobacteriaceae bacterium]